jgi:hypothetical protein
LLFTFHSGESDKIAVTLSAEGSIMLNSPIVLIDTVIRPVLAYIGKNQSSLPIFIGALSCHVSDDNPVDRLGCFNISHDQHWNCWDNYIALNPAFASKIRGLASQHRFLEEPDAELTLNSGYAAAIAALIIEQHLDGELADNSFDFDLLIRAWSASGGYLSNDELMEQCSILKSHYIQRAA